MLTPKLYSPPNLAKFPSPDDMTPPLAPAKPNFKTAQRIPTSPGNAWTDGTTAPPPSRAQSAESPGGSSSLAESHQYHQVRALGRH